MRSRLKRILVFFAILLSLSYPRPVRADLWGGDIPLLIQIVANTLQQLAQLRAILGNAQDSLALMRDINRGINDALNVARTISGDRSAGVFENWKTVDEALRQIQDIYGIVVPSPNSRIEQTTDQSVAEAVKLNNSVYDYTKQIDELGEQIKSYSHAVSPGGAQKLTAQTLGVMLHVMNQSLRTQATGLKLQAQSLELVNRREKESSREIVQNNLDLKNAMSGANPKFQTPRF